jgi:hypothetical protein
MLPVINKYCIEQAVKTGSIPGIAASTRETWLFGSDPNAVEELLNNLEFDFTWACISRPITVSQSYFFPFIKLIIIFL